MQGDIFSDLIMALNRRRVGLKGEAPPKKRTKKAKAPAAYAEPTAASHVVSCRADGRVS
jgi:hypothetical protein